MHILSIDKCISMHNTTAIFVSIPLKEYYSNHYNIDEQRIIDMKRESWNDRIVIKSESLSFEYLWMMLFLYLWKLTLCDICIYGCAEFIWQNCRMFALLTWYIAFIHSEMVFFLDAFNIDLLAHDFYCHCKS